MIDLLFYQLRLTYNYFFNQKGEAILIFHWITASGPKTVAKFTNSTNDWYTVGNIRLTWGSQTLHNGGFARMNMWLEYCHIVSYSLYYCINYLWLCYKALQWLCNIDSKSLLLPIFPLSDMHNIMDCNRALCIFKTLLDIFLLFINRNMLKYITLLFNDLISVFHSVENGNQF